MLGNWTKAETTTTGTGNITLTAVTGFPRPSNVFADGAFVQYSILASDGKKEAGIGKTAASNVLERTLVSSTWDGTTYNSTTATALSLPTGTHEVLITPISANLFAAAPFPLTHTAGSNRNVTSCHITQTQSNNTPIGNQRNIGWPFLLQTAGVITGFSIFVATAQSGSTVHLGLYEVASDGIPGRLITKTSAAIDTSTTGYKTQASVANVRVTPGWYWQAWCSAAGSNPTVTSGTQHRHPYGNQDKDGIGYVREDATHTDLQDPFPRTSISVQGGNSQAAPLIGLLMS